MYKENPAIKSPDNENTVIWRYMDFTKFVSLLQKKALFFSRADMFPDKFEGSLTNYSKALRPYYYPKGLPPEGIAAFCKEMEALFKLAPTFTFINCWNMSEVESAAMWNLYLSSNQGIAIESSFMRLRDSIITSEYEVLIGKVEYSDYKKTIIDQTSLLHPFVHKRSCFSHEKEIRAIVQEMPTQSKSTNSKKGFVNNGIYIDVDIGTLIKNVVIYPCAPDWYKELVVSIITKYDYRLNIKISDLESDPVW